MTINASNVAVELKCCDVESSETPKKVLAISELRENTNSGAQRRGG